MFNVKCEIQPKFKLSAEKQKSLQQLGNDFLTTGVMVWACNELDIHKELVKDVIDAVCKFSAAIKQEDYLFDRIKQCQD